MRRSIAIVAVGAFALGCVSVARVGERVPGAVIAERVALEIGCEGESSDELTLQGAELAGDTLRLDLAHGGGCSEHSYRVCAAREVLESDPGQWVITVLHDAHGDACRAEITSRPLTHAQLHDSFDLYTASRPGDPSMNHLALPMGRSAS
jgi:hypothetical protein